MEGGALYLWFVAMFAISYNKDVSFKDSNIFFKKKI